MSITKKYSTYIIDSIISLEAIVTVPLTADDFEKYEELADEIITTCISKSEKICRKVFMEGVVSSPK